MKIVDIRCTGLAGGTVEGGWVDDLKPEDDVHTIVEVLTDDGPSGVGSAFRVRWLASYAGLPGTERLWYQRVDTFPAAKPPKIVRMSQRPITGQRCREVRCARRVSMGISCSQRSGSSTEDRIRAESPTDHWPQGDGRVTKVGLSTDFGRLVSRGTRA